MKKVSVILLNLLVAASVVFLSSCKKDPDAPLPTIDFTSTPEASYAFNSGTNFNLGVKVYAPEKLKQVDVQLVVSGLPNQNLENFPKKSGFTENNTTFEATLSIPIASSWTNGTKVEVRVIAKDKGANGGRTIERSFFFTVGEAGSGRVEAVDIGAGGSAPTLSGIVEVTLGDQGATEGSYLRTDNGTVYTTSQVDALDSTNAAKIDITLGQSTGGSVGAGKIVLISPALRASDNDAALFGTNFNFGSAGANKSSSTDTYFASTTLDPATATAEEVDELGISSSQDYMVITVDGKYAFVNDMGKKGVIKVKSIQNSGSGKSVILEYVVQK
ncbi:MAG: hypothetical protein KatS3mg033_2104 [Thermonema sp.]|uniref:hypothetical protein n=1 Tax=Thermonema sp. TaxID=2231181 RepID=UPI0021DC5E79|nr:hypothetical protein [Thermonema sp.]GIV40304.1 MAG: hypothetical protein KatS3mg033_2104 [Thermonema sp.]